MAVLALRRSDRNASAASLIALSEALGRAWRRFLTAKEEKRTYEFAELCNFLEIACAILADKAIHGVARKIVDELMEATLLMIDEDQDAYARLKALREKPSTFQYLTAFLNARRSRITLFAETSSSREI